MNLANKIQEKEGFNMCIIPQISLFNWENDIENLGDLERLHLTIEHMPDGELIRVLEIERKNGRDDYPVKPMWNALLAGVVFQHISIESLRRELARNAQLRYMCGFGRIDNTPKRYRRTRRMTEPELVPPAYVFTRFLKKLMKHEKIISGMFDKLIEKLQVLLPGFGKDLSIDSKAISSLANEKNKNEKTDGRRDNDADYGRKDYKGVRKDGTTWEKVVKWFGYKLHLIVDSNYELPVAYSVTKASVPDINEAHTLIDKIEEKRPEILDNCETLEGDRAYDDTKLIVTLFNDHEIKTIIDIRNMWKDPDKTRLLLDYDNITYNYRGNVYCHCLETGVVREMPAGGFEEDRMSLKKLCPAKAYGTECKCKEKCYVKSAIRIPIDTDRRIFTPIDRSSYKWKRYYDKRTSVERVNSRIDESFGFEKHYIRGMEKMKIRCGLALCIMLAIAVGRIKQEKPELMRSLVKATA